MKFDKAELNILLEQLKNGDEHAFDEIYKRCKGHVAFVCSKLCNSKEDAEEVVNDTFLAIYMQAPTLKPDTFLGLLRKIAARKCFDKRKKNDQSLLVYDSESSEVIDIAELNKDFLPEEYLQSKESQQELLHIVNGLSPKQREMMYLYYYADISTEEIAKLNNCSSANVRKILYMARNVVKSKITHKAAKGAMSLVPISLIFAAEAEVFAMSYVGTAITIGTTTFGTASTISTKIVATVACTVAAIAIAATVYFVLPMSQTEAQDAEPQILESQVPAVTTYAQETILTTEPITDLVAELATELTTEPITELETEPATESITYPATEVEASTEPVPTQAVTYPVTEATVAYEPPTETVPVTEPAIEQPLVILPTIPDDVTDYFVYDEPTPIPLIPQILAALELANTPESVNSIISYYGFTITAQMRSSANEEYRFYLFYENGSEVLIGVAQNDDGGNWRIKFGYFPSSLRPQDRVDLFRWMES